MNTHKFDFAKRCWLQIAENGPKIEDQIERNLVKKNNWQGNFTALGSYKKWGYNE